MILGFRKRNISKRQSFYDLIEQIKRILNKSEREKQTEDDGRTYYDAINGVSF